jgi:Flp pilus assembly pilin Flp
VATHRKPWQTRDLEDFARSLAGDDDGQTMAEYAVVLGVLVLACIAAFPALSAVINDLFGQVADAIKSA